MSKADRKQKRPNIAPAAVLRAPLETAWWAETSTQQTPEQLRAALQSASEGLKPEVMIGVVLPVFADSQPEVQANLEHVLLEWLARQDGLRVLEALVSQGRLPMALQAIALTWLAASGRDVHLLSPSADESTFHSEYELDDGFQAAVCVLWYSNPQRNRARGLQLLIDYNSPWDGSIKEVRLFPNKPPEMLIRRYVEMWKERGRAMALIDAAALKRKLVITAGGELVYAVLLDCTMTAKARLAVIGTGWCATYAHIPGLQAHPRAELVALCDSNPKKLQAAASAYGVQRVYASASAMLDQEALDGVVIATPHATHAALAQDCLSRGLHVLLEKAHDAPCGRGTGAGCARPGARMRTHPGLSLALHAAGVAGPGAHSIGQARGGAVRQLHRGFQHRPAAAG
jgi:hypothetical protein